MVGSNCFSRTPFSPVPRVPVVEPCQGHTHKRIDVFILAKGGDGVPTKPPDEGKTGWIVWWIWRHSAVEQWKLLSVTQRWRRRTERHLKHATYRFQRTSCGVTTLVYLAVRAYILMTKTDILNIWFFVKCPTSCSEIHQFERPEEEVR
jgi:hypothetical protein